MPTTLDKVDVGRSGTITKVEGSGPVKTRLRDMGFVRGAEFEVVRKAPFGDPIELTIKGYQITLRKAQGKLIVVEVDQ